jgi:hypothetical protein
MTLLLERLFHTKDSLIKSSQIIVTPLVLSSIEAAPHPAFGTPLPTNGRGAGG